MKQSQFPTRPADAPHRLLSCNPNTGRVLGSVPVCDEAEVRAAVVRARAAQPAWAATPLRQRITQMQQIQESLVDHAAEITTLVSQEMGKSETDTLIGDVLLLLNNLAAYIKLAPEALRTRRLPHSLLHITKRTYVVREPVGVVAIISPFNFPVLLSLQSAFAALIAGNAVVHKPSEFAPLTALHIQALLYAAGLGHDLFQVVTGGGETGWQLVHAGVDYISFVGASKTGRQVAAAAGEQLIPATLELGGNNAMIVLEDAPLVRAADGALAYAFAANGQICGSISRLYVHETIAPAFINQLAARLSQWTTSTDVRPGGGEVTALVSEEAVTRVEQQVQAAVAAGARVLAGGRRCGNTTAPLFPPTILLDTTPAMSIMQEETFGPVLCVMRVAHEQEAVSLLNDSAYGLTASIWTRDNGRAWEIARQLQVATVAINDHLWPFFAPDVPWGGIKASGLGRVGGRAGLQAMTYSKVISYDRLSLAREFYWYPRPGWLYFVLLLLIPLLFSQQPRKRLNALRDLLAGLAGERSAGHQTAGAGPQGAAHGNPS